MLAAYFCFKLTKYKKLIIRNSRSVPDKNIKKKSGNIVLCPETVALILTKVKEKFHYKCKNEVCKI